MPFSKVYDYYATTAAGLEEVVAQDLRRHLPGICQLRLEPGGRHGRIFFHYERSPGRLLDLRSVDNLFALLAQVHGVTVGPPGLRQLAGTLSRIDLTPALALYDRLHPGSRRTACRLVCTVSGAHRFSAGDLFQAVREALGEQHQIAEETAGDFYPLHLQVAGRRALWGLQLAPRRLRDRPYRQADVPGGLEATVAYCMARLAGARRGDVCLDPMCGGGTTLIEAGLASGPRLLLGGDLARPTLAAARQNAGAAGVRLGLVAWDARDLPLGQASVDAVLCNLPYGKKVTAPEDERRLLCELARVMRPGRRAVLLAGAATSLESLLDTLSPAFALQQRLRLHLRGVDPVLYVLERRSDRPT